jgi:hypothetical protein
MMFKEKFDPEIGGIRDKISRLIMAAEHKPLSSALRKKIDFQLRELIVELERALTHIDPVSMPIAIFDPNNPKIIGRFTALAMVAQPRHPLAEIGRFYGSGVYAIYYTGAFPLYRSISGSETPIYVGQAAPSSTDARTPRDQGERLAARLNEHRKNIAKAATTLQVDDFEARFLVVQSGWETSAEDYLISLFKPIWNSEVNILYGLGKHGDKADTRKNKRSPWDTLHPGRKWAKDTTEDARTLGEIERDLSTHFNNNPPFNDHVALLNVFLDELRQN